MNAKSKDKIIHERVLEATRDMLISRGVRGWNMDMLSERVGVSKRTLYKIIGTREKIIGEVFIGYIKSLQATLSCIIASETDYPKALHQMINLYPEMLNTDFIEIIPDIFREYPDLETRVLAHRDEMTQKIIGFIGKGMESGFLEKAMPPEDVFDILRGLVHYYATTSRNRHDMSARLKKALTLVIRGLKSK